MGVLRGVLGGWLQKGLGQRGSLGRPWASSGGSMGHPGGLLAVSVGGVFFYFGAFGGSLGALWASRAPRGHFWNCKKSAGFISIMAPVGPAGGPRG